MPPSKRRPARLAMPFLATLTMLPACAQENAQGHPSNHPPPPPSAAATNPPGVAAPTNPPPPSATSTNAAVSGPNKRIIKRPDGTCWEQESVNCPPGATCNPPPPMKVSCPP